MMRHHRIKAIGQNPTDVQYPSVRGQVPLVKMFKVQHMSVTEFSGKLSLN